MARKKKKAAAPDKVRRVRMARAPTNIPRGILKSEHEGRHVLGFDDLVHVVGGEGRIGKARVFFTNCLKAVWEGGRPVLTKAELTCILCLTGHKDPSMPTP